MANSSKDLQAAAARRALAVLERYGRDVRQLAADPLEAEHYRAAGEQMDEIRRCCAVVPEFSLPVTMLLISHAEFVQHLWNASAGRAGAGVPSTRQMLQVQLSRVDELATACYSFLDSGSTPH
jgi:hypothetical protein